MREARLTLYDAKTDRPPFDRPLIVVWLGKVQMATWNSTVANWQEWPDGDLDCGGEVTEWGDPQSLLP